jgi:hypothetical protein
MKLKKLLFNSFSSFHYFLNIIHEIFARFLWEVVLNMFKNQINKTLTYNLRKNKNIFLINTQCNLT